MPIKLNFFHKMGVEKESEKLPNNGSANAPSGISVKHNSGEGVKETSGTTLKESASNSSTNDSSTSTPKLAKGAKLEKTLKIRKSQVSPNELVVVGSERDIAERKQVNSLSSKQDISSISSNNSKSSRTDSSVIPGDHSVFLPSASSSSQEKTSSKPNTSNKPVVLKQSVNMKQVIVKKSTSPRSSPTPSSNQITSNQSSNPNSNSANLNNKSVSLNTGSKGSNNSNKSVNSKTSSTAPFRKILPKPSSNKSPPESSSQSQSALPNAKTAKSAIGAANTSEPKLKTKITNNGNTSAPNGVKTVTSSASDAVQRRLKKRPGRAPADSSHLENAESAPLSTELGFGEKQNVAHGVLLQLLRVTSQLPMIEFSHALETIEMLTDAFRLGQKVTLSIRRKHDDMLKRKSIASPLQQTGNNKNSSTNSTPTDGKKLIPNSLSGSLTITQLDGCSDWLDKRHQITTSLSQTFQSEAHPQTYVESAMNSQHNNSVPNPVSPTGVSNSSAQAMSVSGHQSSNLSSRLFSNGKRTNASPIPPKNKKKKLV